MLPRKSGLIFAAIQHVAITLYFFRPQLPHELRTRQGQPEWTFAVMLPQLN